MYLTARPYLLAGFTAASIVAAIPLATRPTVYLPSIHSADVRFAAAESEMASAVGTLRNVEARVLASVVGRTSTTVIPGIARGYRAATGGGTVPSTQSLAPSPSGVEAPNAATGTSVHQPDMPRRLTTTAQAGAIAPSDLVPLIGDVAAFNFDLLGTPFAAITALSFAGDLAISDLSSGELQDIPGDVSNSLQFSIGSTLNLLTADVNNLTNAVNALSAIVHPAPPGTQSAADTGAVGTPKATAATPARTLGGAFDPAAIGPLIGDAAILGLDAVATPFQLAQSLTGALSAAALDLGAGQVQDAQQDFVSSLHGGFVEAESRLNNDLSSIGAALARLTGTAGTPAAPGGAVTSGGAPGTALEDGKAASSATQSHPTEVGARPVVSLTQPAPSKPAAKPLGGDDPRTTAHNPGAVATPATTASTASQHQPSDAPKTADASTRQGGGSAADTKPAKQSPTAAGVGASGTNTPKHAAPGQPHTSGPKHSKH
jgi:hypothetical protein